MQNYMGVCTLAALIALVVIRVRLLKRQGVKSFRFGELDRKDFLLPPFALLYIYHLCALTVGLPTIPVRELFRSDLASRLGTAFCILGLVLFIGALVSFRKSFRVGIDTQAPGNLVTTGVFSVSRNPIYTAFLFVLSGEFLIRPDPVVLVYLSAGVFVINRQILREEEFLERHYGNEYRAYRTRVRRYL